MEFIRLNVEDPLLPIRCLAPGYLSDKGKWITFIQEAQFAFRPIDRAGVHKYPSLDQVAMYICYHAADIPLRVRASICFCLFLAHIDVLFDPICILKKIAVVN